MLRTTLVLGASIQPSRYSYKAIQLLKHYRHNVVAVGRDKGEIFGVKIQPNVPADISVDTVTLYLSPNNQKMYYEEVLKLKPRRIIFNPGTENEELQNLARQNNIATEEACTLVLLNTGQY